MLLPSASHNTPEGRAKLRREAKLETRAALDKINLQAEQRKRLHRQTLERNIKKLQNQLTPKLAKLQFVKREIDIQKGKKQVAETKDQSLDQEQTETKKSLVEFDQALTKLAVAEKTTVTKLTTLQNELSKAELGNNAKQAELAKAQVQVEEKTREVDELKNQLVEKSNLYKSNKARVQELKDEIDEKEKALQQKQLIVAANTAESVQNKAKWEELREEVNVLKKQLQLKEKEIVALEATSRTLETKAKTESQEVKQGDTYLEKLRTDLRHSEILSTESGRAVGYLERKIKEGTNHLHILAIQSGPKFDPLLSKLTTLRSDLELLNKQLNEIRLEKDQKIHAKDELEQQNKSAQLVELNISTEVRGLVGKIRVLEYEQTKLEKEIDAIGSEIEKLERELR